MYQRTGNWTTEFYHEGIRYKKSLGRGISKTVAKEREVKFKIEVREGKHHQKARKIKFETFAEKYLEHARLNNTRKIVGTTALHRPRSIGMWHVCGI